MGSLQNQLKSIGELDERIGFATKTEEDIDGANRETYSVPDTDVPAKIRYDNTTEADSTVSQEKFTTEIKVWCRYDSSITPEHYVYWNDKYYDIYAIEGTPRQRFIVIKARLIET